MSQPFDVNSSTSLDLGGNAEQANLVERNWSAEDFRQVLESAPDAMVLVDDHGQTALFNVQTEQLFGYDRDELLDQPVELLMSERFRDRLREQLVDIFEDPHARAMSSGLELCGLRKNRSEFPVEIRVSPIETAGGTIVSIAIRDVTQRKQSAAAVDEARILAEAIVETVREPLLILNDNLNVQTANQSFYQTFGTTPRDTENQLIYELDNHQWDIPQLRHLLEHVLPDKRQFNDFEVQHCFERIGQRTMLLNARTLDREGERPGLILLAIEDITDRKQLEAQLRETNLNLEQRVQEVESTLAELDRLAAIVESSDDAIIGKTLDGMITSWNRGAEQLYGYSADEIIGRPIARLAPDHADEVASILERLKRGEKVDHFETLRVRKDGTLVNVSLTISPIVGADRKIRGASTIARDITDRKRADDLVAHLSTMPEENPNPVVETDLAGNVTYLNPAARAQLPDLEARAPQHPFLDGLKPLVAALEKAETDSFVREVEVGDEIYEQKTHVAQSNVIRIFANNITSRKRADKELKHSAAKLKRYNRELERSNGELQDFAYVVSHDLRAPLVNLQGFSKELALSCERLPSVLADVQMPEAKRRELSALLEEDIPEALEFITTNATKMDGLLSGVLKLSRVGQAALTIRPLDINQMFSGIVASRQFAIEQAGASVQVGSLPTCQGDEMQINQVLSNLLDNALKYLDPNRRGVIRVGGQEEPDGVVYSIEDNGIGIAEEHQDSIYKVFHRLDPQRGTGEGLGLTIVRRILDRHGGKIRVESEVNEGSKFYLSLPKG